MTRQNETLSDSDWRTYLASSYFFPFSLLLVSTCRQEHTSHLRWCASNSRQTTPPHPFFFLQTTFTECTCHSIGAQWCKAPYIGIPVMRQPPIYSQPPFKRSSMGRAVEKRDLEERGEAKIRGTVRDMRGKPWVGHHTMKRGLKLKTTTTKNSHKNGSFFNLNTTKSNHEPCWYQTHCVILWHRKNKTLKL